MMENKGEIVIFGAYPQNSEDVSAKEPIEWLVLDRKDDCILYTSKYLLDCKPYHKELEKVTWATCTLRQWLNEDFYNLAFTAEEQKRILVSDVKNPCQATEDRIFLLSNNEAETYFELEKRCAKTTAYTRAKGAWYLSEENDIYNGNGSWWLRYPEYMEDEDEEDETYEVLSCVNFDGYIEAYADEVNAENCSVRPALWLKL